MGRVDKKKKLEGIERKRTLQPQTPIFFGDEKQYEKATDSLCS